MMEELLTQIAQEIQRKVYGKYRGFVVDNADPEKRARLRLRVPSVLATEVTGWALPCLPFGGLPGQGWFAVPEKDAQVWVEFEEGDISCPIWTGTFWQQQGDPPQEKEETPEPPTTRLLKTRSHLIKFDDKEGEERFVLTHPKKAQIEIDKEGTVAVTDAKGAKLTLDAKAGKVTVKDANGNTLTMSSSGTTVEDANGNKVEMAAAGVTVSGKEVVVKVPDGGKVKLGGEKGEPLLKAETFLKLFNNHVHPGLGVPPAPPLPIPSLVSTKVTSA